MICSHTSPFLHGLRCVAATLMLMPFLALCLLSPAAMLERNASGLLVMVLCTGDGAVEMAVDLGTGNKNRRAANQTALRLGRSPCNRAGRSPICPANGGCHPPPRHSNPCQPCLARRL